MKSYRENYLISIKAKYYKQPVDFNCFDMKKVVEFSYKRKQVSGIF